MQSSHLVSTAVFLKYLLVMSAVTYAVRMLPFVLCKEKIQNRFLRSFLYYIPYAVLGAMTFPAVFFSTGTWISAVAGTVVAVVLGFLGKGLVFVAAFACATVFFVELLVFL